MILLFEEEGDDSGETIYILDTPCSICLYPKITIRIPNLSLYLRVYLNLLFPWIKDNRIKTLGIGPLKGTNFDCSIVECINSAQNHWGVAKDKGLACISTTV